MTRNYLNDLKSSKVLKSTPKKSGKSQSLPPKMKGKAPRPSRTNG